MRTRIPIQPGVALMCMFVSRTYAESVPVLGYKPKLSIPLAHVDAALRANEQMKLGKLGEAEATYQRICAAAPNNFYVLTNLAVAQYRQQKLRQAEETLKQAAAVEPQDDFVHCVLGVVYLRQDKLDAAITSFTRALAINGRNGAAHGYLGAAAMKKGWAEAAEKQFAVAAKLNSPWTGSSETELAQVLTLLEKTRREIPMDSEH